jgi:hypothetical protein
MFRRFIAFLLTALLVVPVTQPDVIAAPLPLDAEKDARLAERVKDGIAKLGVGRESRVEVKLKNKTKLAGYISAIEDESFTLTNMQTGQATTIPYPDIAQVKGNNLTTRTKVIIAASIIAGIVIVLYIVRGAFCDGC